MMGVKKIEHYLYNIQLDYSTKGCNPVTRVSAHFSC